jgi:hypothetical protein
MFRYFPLDLNYNSKVITNLNESGYNNIEKKHFKKNL